MTGDGNNIPAMYPLNGVLSEIPCQNLKRYCKLRVSKNLKMMHCVILFNMPYPIHRNYFLYSDNQLLYGPCYTPTNLAC